MRTRAWEKRPFCQRASSQTLQFDGTPPEYHRPFLNYLKQKHIKALTLAMLKSGQRSNDVEIASLQVSSLGSRDPSVAAWREPGTSFTPV